MQILLDSGALFTKCITRIREVYKIPHHTAELVIDTLYSAHGNLEYAELECSSVKVLRSVLEDIFGMNKKDISHVGIGDLYDEKLEKVVTKKLKYLAEIIQK